MIFEACAQTPNLDFEATLWRFLRFFKYRFVFARVGQRERKSNEQVLKSTSRNARNRPKIDQNRVAQPFSSHFGRQSRSKQPRKANRQANRAARSSQVEPGEPNRAARSGWRTRQVGLCRARTRQDSKPRWAMSI